MNRLPLLPLPDYQRIYQVLYSVLEASGIAVTHRACIFFATVGARSFKSITTFLQRSVLAVWRS